MTTADLEADGAAAVLVEGVKDVVCVGCTVYNAVDTTQTAKDRLHVAVHRR